MRSPGPCSCSPSSPRCRTRPRPRREAALAAGEDDAGAARAAAPAAPDPRGIDARSIRRCRASTGRRSPPTGSASGGRRRATSSRSGPGCIHRHQACGTIPTPSIPIASRPEAKAERHRFQYLPFGGGPRLCVGARFATVEALTVLAHWLARLALRADAGPRGAAVRAWSRCARPAGCRCVPGVSAARGTVACGRCRSRRSSGPPRCPRSGSRAAAPASPASWRWSIQWSTTLR